MGAAGGGARVGGGLFVKPERFCAAILRCSGARGSANPEPRSLGQAAGLFTIAHGYLGIPGSTLARRPGMTERRQIPSRRTGQIALT